MRTKISDLVRISFWNICLRLRRCRMLHGFSRKSDTGKSESTSLYLKKRIHAPAFERGLSAADVKECALPTEHMWLRECVKHTCSMWEKGWMYGNHKKQAGSFKSSFRIESGRLFESAGTERHLIGIVYTLPGQSGGKSPDFLYYRLFRIFRCHFMLCFYDK